MLVARMFLGPVHIHVVHCPLDIPSFCGESKLQLLFICTTKHLLIQATSLSAIFSTIGRLRMIIVGTSMVFKLVTGDLKIFRRFSHFYCSYNFANTRRSLLTLLCDYFRNGHWRLFPDTITNSGITCSIMVSRVEDPKGEQRGRRRKQMIKERRKNAVVVEPS